MANLRLELVSGIVGQNAIIPRGGSSRHCNRKPHLSPLGPNIAVKKWLPVISELTMAMDQTLRDSGIAPTLDPERVAYDQPLEKPQKSYHTILEQHVAQAQEELERPAGGLLLSSLSAGLDLGFGPLLMAVLLTLSGGTWPQPVAKAVLAAAYAVGFVFVVLGRSALFTEQTTSAVLPVLARRA